VVRPLGILGAHVSIAGGISNSVARAYDIGCETFQIFTRNQRQWKAPPLDMEEVEMFRSELNRSGLGPVIAHSSYLINLGAPEDDLFSRSVEAFKDELERCSILGIPYLVVHPGSHKGSGVEAGLKRVAKSLDLAMEIQHMGTMVLLETTAGQGTNLGHTFEHLSEIISHSDHPDHLGICLDTCHIHAAGYDIRTPEAYGRTMDVLDDVIGLESLKVVHVNDSKKELGSRVDRHDNLGDGTIGLEGFSNLVNDERLKKIPMILETPGGEEHYRKNLSLLRSMSK
jgi:deoxyribonuclease-4